MILNDIEIKYNFGYPEIYKQLEEDGMLDVGEYGSDWYSTFFPKLKDNPTFLLNIHFTHLLVPSYFCVKFIQSNKQIK